MISANEVHAISVALGVPFPYIEKDYVMGWLLNGIYANPTLARNLVLKGGNCLRKVYFSDTRFSDDLDFTAYQLNTEREFHDQLVTLCRTVSTLAGIEFAFDKTQVEVKQTPDRDSKAIDGRVYFKGFAGDSSITMRIKFDVSEYERIVLPLQRHPIIHNYSDADSCRTMVSSYSLEEVLAEKLRSWIQRTRSRDLFDVVKIIQSKAVPISKTNIINAFFQKTLLKQIPLAGRDEMLYDAKFDSISTNWTQTVICPASAMIVAANAVSLFKEFVTALFDPATLQLIGLRPTPGTAYAYNIQSGIREAIIEAGKSRQLIRMRYEGRERDIEPYSFRFRMTQDYGAEYFYGFDRTRGQTIKSFFLNKIQAVSLLPQKFIPRWVVEF